jgi:DNA-binding beta-propeller fold protein YncE
MNVDLRFRRTCFAAITGLVLMSSPATKAQDSKYQAVADWAHLPTGMQWGSVTSASTDGDGNVYVFRRSQPPILELDKNGSYLRGLGAGVIVSAHGIRLDSHGMIWAADVRGHAVYKMDPAGTLLLTIGRKGVAGDGPDTFNGPTDVLVTSTGDIFVTDGQFNSRVVHFSADGKFLKAWGTNGTEPGQFKVPHAIAIDSKGRLFVADRDNGRVQIFDQDGKFLEQWTQFGPPSGIFIAPDDTLYVAAIGDKSGLVIGSAGNGRIHDFIPIPAKDLNGPHLVTANASGTVYVADLLSSELRKFVRTRTAP